MKNIVIILDPAHGIDVKGKRSPDGTHLEYLWSRERIDSLQGKLQAMGYEVARTTYGDTEPGLTYRRNFATAYNAHGKKKVFLSLHNNAKGNGTTWEEARGMSVFTCKGASAKKTDTAYIANIIFDRYEADFDASSYNIRMRNYDTKKLHKNFEENFTVLMGNGYSGVLIECLFQDNKDDVALLKDASFNELFEESTIRAINEINDYFSEKG